MSTTRRVAASTVAALALVGGAGALYTSTSQAALNANALYVSPNGSASAAGTASAPTTLASAITRIGAGGTIYLRGGTYSSGTTVTIGIGNNGTASAFKEIAAYPGETPVLDFSPMAEAAANRGLVLGGNYWHLVGFTVQGAGDNGIFVSGSHNVLERLVTRRNRDTGLQLGRAASTTARADWPSYNLVVSSESYDNRDSAGENADGFAAKLTVGPGNVFRYDVAHNNIDDGWDLFAKSETGPIDPVVIENSLAYSNGTLTNGTQAAAGDRNGFKLGGDKIAVNHVIRNSVAYKNGQHGLTWNSNPGTISVSGNVSIDNAQRNFAFDGGTSVFRDNTSCRFAGSVTDKITGSADGTNQFWGGSNGSRCATFGGALNWSFAANGALSVTFGGKAVTTSPAPAATKTTTPATSAATQPSTVPTPKTSTTAATVSPKVSPSVSTAAPVAVAPGTRLFSDDFEDGVADGWYLSGGAWAVRTSTTKVLSQSATGLARGLRGNSAWTAVDVRVTVTPTKVTGAGAFVAVLAGVKDGSNYYSLALRDANKVELRRVVGGRQVVLASAPVKAATGKAFTLRLVVRNGVLTGSVDGKALVTVKDSTFTRGMIGLSTNNESATFDTVTVHSA